MRVMRRQIVALAAALALFLPIAALAKSMTDAEVRDAMIAQSISEYPGNCPCPYNRASNGSRCGKRSAWSKPGGYSPLCFREDISDDMVKQYRKAHAISAPGQ